jgi:hypothetical protein
MTVLARLSRAADSLFKQLGMEAAYLPTLGSALAVVAIPRRPDSVIGLGDIGAVTEATLFDLRVAEVTEPKAGDVIEYLGESYRVIGEPRCDIHRLIWTVEAEKL